MTYFRRIQREMHTKGFGWIPDHPDQQVASWHKAVGYQRLLQELN